MARETSISPDMAFPRENASSHAATGDETQPDEREPLLMAFQIPPLPAPPSHARQASTEVSPRPFHGLSLDSQERLASLLLLLLSLPMIGVGIRQLVLLQGIPDWLFWSAVGNFFALTPVWVAGLLGTYFAGMTLSGGEL